MMLADQVCFLFNFSRKKNKNSLFLKLIAAPLLNAAMIAYLPLVNGKSFDEIKLKFLMDFPTVMKANYLVWPLIQLTNFYFIPVHHR
jgi:protein Mpv17